MVQMHEIRDGGPSDIATIQRLYASALLQEDLRPLIEDLLRGTPGVLSLVAMADAALVGHVAFTPCGVAERREAVALLGPLAVVPARQERGVGSALVRKGTARLGLAAFTRVFVLGDPAWYGRFGFRAETSVAPPFELPEEWRGAWQSCGLHGSTGLAGTLTVPPPWNRPALWAP